MYTVAETPVFTAYVSDYWTEDERGAFCAWLALHADAGDVIPGSGGCRKIRWGRKGVGKRGGVQVIYDNVLADGAIWLLTIYGKNVAENIPAHELKILKEMINATH